VADPFPADEVLDARRPALVALVPPAPCVRAWRFPSTARSVGRVRGLLRPFLTESGFPDDEADDLVLAACEAATNGVEHAHHPTEPFIDVLVEVVGTRVRIVVRDYGRWTPWAAGSPHRGRGLRMMNVLTAVSLTSGPQGTSVTLQNLADARAR
jgi:anti-sigma regulatory factor (Ser/Thr protein kinase)